MSKLPKHHYIPVLYLSQWARNGRFTEISRPAGRDRAESRGTGARGTGYVRGLYRLTGDNIPEELAEQVERKFMGTVDNLAKEALDIVLHNSHTNWTDKTRSAWARFVNGLIFRVPERVASARKFLEEFWLADFEKHKAKYDAQRAESAPDFLDYVIHDVNRDTLEFMMKQIDNVRIGTLLGRMRWRTIDVAPVGRPLFTSDRPVIMSNGLAYDDAHLLLPVSPTRLFLATQTAEMEQYFAYRIPRRELVKICNRHVVRRAQKYVWNIDDSELDFVRKHLSVEAHMDSLMWETVPSGGPDPKRPISRA
ncbi:DUF4238 domain-containing protein [Bradyrhizobium betae]